MKKIETVEDYKKFNTDWMSIMRKIVHDEQIMKLDPKERMQIQLDELTKMGYSIYLT